MKSDDLIEEFKRDLYIALTVCKWRPPKTLDRTESDDYRRRVAESVTESLRTGWEFKRKPPLDAH
jgi:hypothetical protein